MNSETPIEKIKADTFTQISRLAHNRSVGETSTFVESLYGRWKNILPMDRDREIVAFFKNPRAVVPDDLNDPVLKGELMRERVNDLREIIGLINWLRNEVVKASSKPLAIVKDPSESDKQFIEDLRRESLQQITHLSGRSKIECAEFIRRFLNTSETRERRQACLQLCPRERRMPNDLEMKRFLNERDKGPLVVGPHGAPLEIAPAYIPVKVHGFELEEAKAGMVFETLTNLRAEMGRCRDREQQRKRQAQLARSRFEQLGHAEGGQAA